MSACTPLGASGYALEIRPELNFHRFGGLAHPIFIMTVFLDAVRCRVDLASKLNSALEFIQDIVLYV